VSLELPGSAVNGALLDASPMGLIHDSRNSFQAGRYVFEVNNGGVPGSGSIEGTVRGPASDAVPGASVEVCHDDGTSCAWYGTTNGPGQYRATGLADGDYVVRAFPPPGSSLIPAEIAVTVTDQMPVTRADIELGGPVPPPPGTGISPSHPGGGGVPVLYWHDVTTLTTTGCPGGTASYRIVQDAAVLSPRSSRIPARRSSSSRSSAPAAPSST
jgi:hypothetical protein